MARRWDNTLLLPIEVHVTLCGLEATLKPTLLHPQRCLIVVSLLGRVWNSGIAPADVHLQCGKAVIEDTVFEITSNVQ